MTTMLEWMHEREVERTVLWRDAASGLEAILVIDDVTLGPAAGGVRTRAYPSPRDGFADAAALARAMTIKCALAGLPAGGGKCVVLDHAGLDRARGFRVLGERIAELGGLFRTAGDLGTTAADLAAMASHCEWVHTDESGLAAAVGHGVLRCVEACAELRGVAVAGLTIAVQGCGSIGAAVARRLAGAGARLIVADLDAARARAVASETGATVGDPAAILTAPVDVIAPCAVGGVVDVAVARAMRAWAICGAANNQLASPEAEDALIERGILFVPDVVASGGAVIEGIGRTVMQLADRTPLIDALGTTAHQILEEARASGARPTAIAQQRARARIATRRG
ncbi:MAG TPA: Glu/Leu/Phe/Val dehydrogenase dimerization domain-containing protein [Kofleriaceae bacterium]|jgi:leucine dehydrogenase|nr:Glu/Leu/Phe/Val dehydrogenase dimerization domain-containing protein [Kofleriaceae bacterium]